MHHLKLFQILFDGNFPENVVKLCKIMINWYGKMFATVRRSGALSNTMFIKSGALQSSVLSQNLFNMYVDVVIDALIKSG